MDGFSLKAAVVAVVLDGAVAVAVEHAIAVFDN